MSFKCVCGLVNSDLNVCCVFCKRAKPSVFTKANIEQAEDRLDRANSVVDLIPATVSVNEVNEVNENPSENLPQSVPSNATELAQKPVDAKKSELEAYKYFANQLLPSLDEIINKHGNDTEAILDEFEARIVQFQKDQFVFRTWEFTVRSRRAILIKERNSTELEKKRKKDLTYVPFVPGVSSVLAKKVVKASGKSKKDKLIDDLVAKGLSRDEAVKLIG